MPSLQLLQIVVGELENGDSNRRLLYGDIVKVLWKNQVSGATVIRSDEGIGENDDYRAPVLEDIQFNNLPILIESIDQEERIQSVIPEIKKIIPHGELATFQVYSDVKEECVMNSEFLMMKIYTKENSKWHGKKLYDEIMRVLKEEELIWSTVTRGIEGFGKDHVIHTQSLFSFSSQTPVVIETVGKRETIEKVLPEVKAIVQDGIVIVIPIQVVIDR